MDVNTELLEYIYQSSEMGVVSLTNLLKDINGKENKLKPIISEELSSYEKYQKESKKLLFKNNTEVKENSMMTKMMSIPLALSILSYSISGKINCSLTPIQ